MKTLVFPWLDRARFAVLTVLANLICAAAMATPPAAELVRALEGVHFPEETGDPESFRRILAREELVVVKSEETATSRECATSPVMNSIGRGEIVSMSLNG